MYIVTEEETNLKKEARKSGGLLISTLLRSCDGSSIPGYISVFKEREHGVSVKVKKTNE